MQFRLLGPLEVWDGDERIDLGGAKQRALLALLLLNANRTVRRTQVIDWLWDVAPPRTAGDLVLEYVLACAEPYVVAGPRRGPRSAC
jgi:DNA-binding SARP family transcriptional activator